MKNSLRVVIVFLTFFALACSPKDQTSTLKEAEASISEATFSPDMFVAIPEIV
ncbi:MAG: hypothetical protein NTX25_04590 [Proteobacteria bacterium]|nr:hypothetical protein [Pseudomonadota bacterium]